MILGDLGALVVNPELSRSVDDRETYTRRRITGATDALRSFLKILRLSPRDVEEQLRVSVHERKPGTLNLHHDLMALTKRVTDVRHVEFDLGELTRHHRFGILETISKLRSKRFSPDKLLITPHSDFAGISYSNFV